MKIFTNKSVYEAALDRIRYLYDEFENITVSFSGGKDSTICLQLALIVAEERKRLPLNVIFIDQEAEWSFVQTYMKKVMHDPRIKPYWFQMPIKITNSTSTTDPWLYCWKEGEEENWVHPKDPISIKENTYGTDRFYELFDAIIRKEFKGQSTANLGGVRTQESPARYLGLTGAVTYKFITWGKILTKKLNHFTFYPIYDWGYKDVWKAIHDNKWEYCELYDRMYQYGITVNNMRVSNLHHETAIQNLYILQEIDPKVWEKLTKRLQGINTAGHLQKESISPPKQLPYMFKDWMEYRDYLVKHLVTDSEVRGKFKKYFEGHDKYYQSPLIRDLYLRSNIVAVMTNDTGAKLGNFETISDVREYRAFIRGVERPNNVNNKYILDLKEYEHKKTLKRRNKRGLRFSKR